MVRWGLWAGLGAAAACSLMALGVALGDSMRGPSAQPLRPTAGAHVQALDHFEPAPPPVAAPVEVQVPQAVQDALDDPFPGDVHRNRLNEAFPPAQVVAVAEPTVTREQLDALPESLWSDAERRKVLDAAFPPSWPGLSGRF